MHLSKVLPVFESLGNSKINAINHDFENQEGYCIQLTLKGYEDCSLQYLHGLFDGLDLVICLEFENVMFIFYENTFEKAVERRNQISEILYMSFPILVWNWFYNFFTLD
jgi:hypothetical protein